MIIKCPECGRQVSEKAPVCPSCGVEIAGKVTRCKNCGEVYFLDEHACPACHHSTNAGYAPRIANVPEQPSAAAPVIPKEQLQPANPFGRPVATEPAQPATEEKKNGKGTIIAAVIFAAIICGGLFYFYYNAQSSHEMEDYEYAMRSTDPMILQQYLDRYADAPQEHRDSIEAHLVLLQKGDEEWQNAVLSGSRAALQAYIDHNPESIHCQEARNKIDSLDWISAQNSEDPERIKEYTVQHPDGRYIDEANLLLSKVKSTTVLPDEKTMVTSLFRQFFQSINSRDELRLSSTVAMVISSFLGKQNATAQDVITFMHKIYKDDITNMNWRIDPGSYKIQKREVADNEYEFDVTFNCQQEIERTDASKEKLVTYRTTATVSSDGKISNFNLTKIVNN